MTHLKPGELPIVAKEYMSEGNTGPVEGGRFACLELTDGSRVIGRIGQSFDDLRADALRIGLIAKPAAPKRKRPSKPKAASKPAKKTAKKPVKKK